MHELPVLTEGRYQIDAKGNLADQEVDTLLLSVFMMLLLERMRG